MTVLEIRKGPGYLRAMFGSVHGEIGEVGTASRHNPSLRSRRELSGDVNQSSGTKRTPW